MKKFGKIMAALGIVGTLGVGTYTYLQNKNKVNKIVKKTYDELIK